MALRPVQPPPPIHDEHILTSRDTTNIAWTRAFHAAMTPHLERDVYVNDLGDDEADRVADAYGANYGRLVRPQQ